MSRESRFVWSRRRFMGSTFLGIAGVGLAVQAGAQPSMGTAADSSRRESPKPPPLPDNLVKEFVVAAHGNLDRTRELLGNEPGLLNSTWDWKAGDFETALGGAGHMGRRDIAQYLIGEGARMDLFVAAMLGELPLVQAYLEAHPAMIHSRGPHGISLIAHAKAGGSDAVDTLAWLESRAGD